MGGGYSLLDKSIPIHLKLGYVLGVIEPHWFINIIMILYLLFFISWKFSKNPILAMIILTGLASAGLFYLRFQESWYNANLIFVFGMLYYEKRTYFISFMKKRYLLKLVTTLIGFAVFSLLFTMFKYGILKTVAGCFLAAACAGFLLKIRFKSPVMCFVGKRSMHWYVVHCMNSWYIAKLFARGCDPAVLFVLAILLTAIITTVFFAAEQRVWKMVRRRAGKPFLIE